MNNINEAFNCLGHFLLVIIFLNILLISFASSETNSTLIDAIVKDSLSTNYALLQGGNTFIFDRDCIAFINQVGSCMGNNPDSPYGYLMIPKVPGEYPSNTLNLAQESYGTKYPTGLSPTWRMGADEAIVIRIKTPPKSKYFSFTPYLFSRDINSLKTKSATALAKSVMQKFTSGDRLFILGSVGLSLNNDVLLCGETDCSNKEIIIIISASQTVAKNIKANLINNGINESIINIVGVSTSFFNFGYEKKADEMAFISRVAYPEDPQLANEYFNNTFVTVYRAIPKVAIRQNVLFGNIKTVPRGSGNPESNLSSALDALASAVEAKIKADGFVPKSQNMVAGTMFNTELCLKYGFTCVAESPDTTYILSLPFSLDPSTTTDVYVVGVNSIQSGKATYESISIYNQKYLMGVGAVDDSEFVGTATPFLSYVPSRAKGRNILSANPDKFFVYKFSRNLNCSTDNNCFQVPKNNLFNVLSNGSVEETEGTPGINPEDKAMLIVRQYRDPKTTTGPAYSEVINPKVIISQKKKSILSGWSIFNFKK